MGQSKATKKTTRPDMSPSKVIRAKNRLNRYNNIIAIRTYQVAMRHGHFEINLPHTLYRS